MTSSQGALPQSNTALLLIDVINKLDFPGNEELLAGLPQLAENLARLKRAARQAEIPVIYLNDNFNNWHSNFNEQLNACTKRGSNGRDLAIALKPTKQDFFCSKTYAFWIFRDATKYSFEEDRCKNTGAGWYSSRHLCDVHSK